MWLLPGRLPLPPASPRPPSHRLLAWRRPRLLSARPGASAVTDAAAPTPRPPSVAPWLCAGCIAPGHQPSAAGAAALAAHGLARSRPPACLRACPPARFPPGAASSGLLSARPRLALCLLPPPTHALACPCPAAGPALLPRRRVLPARPSSPWWPPADRRPPPPGVAARPAPPPSSARPPGRCCLSAPTAVRCRRLLPTGLARFWAVGLVLPPGESPHTVI